jgi:hypothetical protein
VMRHESVPIPLCNIACTQSSEKIPVSVKTSARPPPKWQLLRRGPSTEWGTPFCLTSISSLYFGSLISDIRSIRDHKDNCDNYTAICRRRKQVLFPTGLREPLLLRSPLPKFYNPSSCQAFPLPGGTGN